MGNVEAITIFVDDVARAKPFYLEVFGQKLVYEDEDAVAFRFDNLIVNLLRSPAAVELIEPAVVAGSDTGARFQLTVGVDDVDSVCAELERKGVVLVNGPLNRPWGVRTACFADPDGHLWELASPILAA